MQRGGPQRACRPSSSPTNTTSRHLSSPWKRLLTCCSSGTTRPVNLTDVCEEQGGASAVAAPAAAPAPASPTAAAAAATLSSSHDAAAPPGAGLSPRARAALLHAGQQQHDEPRPTAELEQQQQGSSPPAGRMQEAYQQQQQQQQIIHQQQAAGAPSLHVGSSSSSNDGAPAVANAAAVPDSSSSSAPVRSTAARWPPYEPSSTRSADAARLSARLQLQQELELAASSHAGGQQFDGEDGDGGGGGALTGWPHSAAGQQQHAQAQVLHASAMPAAELPTISEASTPTGTTATTPTEHGSARSSQRAAIALDPAPTFSPAQTHDLPGASGDWVPVPQLPQQPGSGSGSPNQHTSSIAPVAEQPEEQVGSAAPGSPKSPGGRPLPSPFSSPRLQAEVRGQLLQGLSQGGGALPGPTHPTEPTAAGVADAASSQQPQPAVACLEEEYESTVVQQIRESRASSLAAGADPGRVWALLSPFHAAASIPISTPNSSNAGSPEQHHHRHPVPAAAAAALEPDLALPVPPSLKPIRLGRSKAPLAAASAGGATSSSGSNLASLSHSGGGNSSEQPHLSEPHLSSSDRSAGAGGGGDEGSYDSSHPQLVPTYVALPTAQQQHAQRQQQHQRAFHQQPVSLSDSWAIATGRMPGMMAPSHRQQQLQQHHLPYYTHQPGGGIGGTRTSGESGGGGMRSPPQLPPRPRTSGSGSNLAGTGGGSGSTGTGGGHAWYSGGSSSNSTDLTGSYVTAPSSYAAWGLLPEVRPGSSVATTRVPPPGRTTAAVAAAGALDPDGDAWSPFTRQQLLDALRANAAAAARGMMMQQEGPGGSATSHDSEPWLLSRDGASSDDDGDDGAGGDQQQQQEGAAARGGGGPHRQQQQWQVLPMVLSPLKVPCHDSGRPAALLDDDTPPTPRTSTLVAVPSSPIDMMLSEDGLPLVPTSGRYSREDDALLRGLDSPLLSAPANLMLGRSISDSGRRRHQQPPQQQPQQRWPDPARGASAAAAAAASGAGTSTSSRHPVRTTASADGWAGFVQHAADIDMQTALPHTRGLSGGPAMPGVASFDTAMGSWWGARHGGSASSGGQGGRAAVSVPSRAALLAQSSGHRGLTQQQQQSRALESESSSSAADHVAAIAAAVAQAAAAAAAEASSDDAEAPHAQQAAAGGGGSSSSNSRGGNASAPGVSSTSASNVASDEAGLFSRSGWAGSGGHHEAAPAGGAGAVGAAATTRTGPASLCATPQARRAAGQAADMLPAGPPA